MKDTTWKWIAIVAIGIVLIIVGWRAWQIWQWSQLVNVRLNNLEQAVVSVHPELGQRAPPPSQVQEEPKE